MNDDNTLIISIFLSIIMGLILGLGFNINNKLYDIREIINGTCQYENTYNGECRSSK